MEETLKELTQQLQDDDPKSRERAADEVVDVIGSIPVGDVSPLALAFVKARLKETVPACQEAQLHALNELNEVFGLPRDIIEPLRQIEVGGVEGSELEYLQNLIGPER